MKKILMFIIVFGAVWVAYVYYQSQQRPMDTYVATDSVTTGDMLTGDELMVDTSTTGVETTAMTMSVAQNSMVWWKATKPGGFHTGSVSLTDGFITVSNDLPTAGEFTMDMTSLKLLDMDNAKLEWEIKNDFFQSATYPTAKFVLTSIENQSSGLVAYGNLTIKDKTNPIHFPVQITTSSDTMNVKASFAVDRLLRGLDMWEGKVNNYFEFMLDINFTPAM